MVVMSCPHGHAELRARGGLGLQSLVHSPGASKDEEWGASQPSVPAARARPPAGRSLPSGGAAHPVHTPLCLTLCHPGQWHNLPALLTPIGLRMGTRELRG